MRFQTYIDGVPAGQPFDAEDASAALAEASDRYDGMPVAGACLTTNGESIEVESAETCMTDALISFAKDAEVSAGRAIPVTARLDGPDESTYFDVQIIGKKGQTFQLVVTPRASS